MIEWLTEFFTASPYLGVAVIFLICGMGFPLPEEVVLITGGYICFRGIAELHWMMLTCAGAILAGDLIPFFLGRTFGARLLRVRWLRVYVTNRRLMMLDRWFRRRGDLVIFFARFVTGLRIVAYFSAGTMKMSYPRFIVLDLIGIGVVVPLFVFIGERTGNYIDEAIDWVKAAERGILIALAAAAALFALWWWLRGRSRTDEDGPSDTYVGPTVEPTTADDDDDDDDREDREDRVDRVDRVDDREADLEVDRDGARDPREQAPDAPEAGRGPAPDTGDRPGSSGAEQ